jgi:hypothetical protein
MCEMKIKKIAEVKDVMNKNKLYCPRKNMKKT